MPKNQYTPLSELPDENDLKKMISNFEYKRIETNQLPNPIINNGLVNKCNSFILAAL